MRTSRNQSARGKSFSVLMLQIVSIALGCSSPNAREEIGEEDRVRTQQDKQRLSVFTSPLSSLGATCSSNQNCSSGYCVDGVCCDEPCTTTCQACSAAKKLHGADGFCGFIAYDTDPDEECWGGACAGDGECKLYNGVPCQTTAQCLSNYCVDGFCCNNVCADNCRACSQAKKGSGVDGVCGVVEIGTDPNDDCQGGACLGIDACSQKLPNGAPCAKASECALGSCSDGVCCDKPCDGTCEACTKTLKGSGSDGKCEPILYDTDPQEECWGGACTGHGECKLYNGVPCQTTAQCLSNYCVDGFCCNNVCTGSCKACSNAKKGSGFNGVCGNIAMATDPDDECAAGLCDGSGACSASLICTPGAVQSCYTGSLETLGLGACVPGTRQCQFPGLTWSPCVGEITPKKEVCGNAIDDDCNGKVNDGCAFWSKRFGSIGDQYPSGVAIDFHNNVALTGFFENTLNLGGTTWVSAGTNDVFIGKWNGSGNHLWSRRGGNSAQQRGKGIAIDSAGNVVVTGTFDGTLDWTNPPLQSLGNGDVFVAKFTANGILSWAKRFGDIQSQDATAITTDNAGNIVIAGGFFGTLNFGGAPLVGAGGGDIFVVKLDPNGNHVWSRRFGDSDVQYAEALASDSAGNLVLADDFSGTINFGGGPLTSAGADDIYLARLETNGSHRWSRRFENAYAQYTEAVTFDSSGNVVLAGFFYGSVDFGGGPLVSAGDTDAYIAKFDPQGNHVWSRRAGGPSADEALAVALNNTDDIFVAGSFRGQSHFGSNSLTSAGGADVFVLQLDTFGDPIWSWRFGDAQEQHSSDLAIDSSGAIVLTGYFAGSIDFGAGLLASTGGYDIFLAKLSF